MLKSLTSNYRPLLRLSLSALLTSVWLPLSLVASPTAQAAEVCTAAAVTTYGQGTLSVNFPVAGTFRVWSRIKAPDATNNSYQLQIDGGCAITIGDAAISTANWTWVDYQDGDTNTKVNTAQLNAGPHTLVLSGREANVEVDRLVFSIDPSCVPTEFGDNCATAATPTPEATATNTPEPTATTTNTPVPTASATNTATPVPTSPGTQPQSGDVDGNQKVDLNDLTLLLTGWSGSSYDLDFNNDSQTNVYDLSILLSHWSQ